MLPNPQTHKTIYIYNIYINIHIISINYYSTIDTHKTVASPSPRREQLNDISLFSPFFLKGRANSTEQTHMCENSLKKVEHVR